MVRNVPKWDPLYPQFNIDACKGPEDLTKLYGKTSADFSQAELNKLFKHYGWGVKYSLPNFEKEAVFRHLVKIVHYMRPDLKPSKEDFEKCNSDAGPGLLLQKCSALPFSLDHPPPPRDQPINHYLEQAIYQFPYRNLERCPSAFPILRNVTENRHVQLTRPGVATDNRDCGQGPTEDGSLGNALDCAIVAAYLLDAGCTKADRDSVNWHSILEDEEKQFLELVWMDWGCDPDDLIFRRPSTMSSETRSKQAAILRRNLIEGLKKRKPETNYSPIRQVWECCTESFHQFLVRYSHHPLHNAGYGFSNDDKPSSSGCIPLSGIESSDPSKNTIQEQMALFFTRPYPSSLKCECVFGGGLVYHQVERRFHELPLRLAFVTDPERPPTSHTTSNITIKYCNWECKWKQATYQWVGGIYPIKRGDSYRYVLFWNHRERHGPSMGDLQYDPQERYGKIRKGFEFTSTDPSKWQDMQSALLFYEKVLRPDPKSLQKVMRAGKSMGPFHRDANISKPDTTASVRVPAQGRKQGIRYFDGNPEDTISPQPTIPMTMTTPQPPYQTHRGHPQSSISIPAKTTEVPHYGSINLQYVEDAGHSYRPLQTERQPYPHMSAHYPRRHQQQPTPPQRMQTGRGLTPAFQSSHQDAISQVLDERGNTSQNEHDTLTSHLEYSLLDSMQSTPQISMSHTRSQALAPGPLFPEASSIAETNYGFMVSMGDPLEFTGAIDQLSHSSPALPNVTGSLTSASFPSILENYYIYEDSQPPPQQSHPYEHGLGGLGSILSPQIPPIWDHQLIPTQELRPQGEPLKRKQPPDDGSEASAPPAKRYKW
ncbi:hypothetical protein I7I48_02601 [Histoplasma ohiense]|nr:hypothetical protein I7I48_02601 [Histoplasma ohiense (nom. inval.)]